MADRVVNFSYSLVATAPSPATSGTSLVVTTGEGTKFPTVPFQATIWPTNSQPISTNAEIVTVTAIATDTLTIVRATEGSTARTVVVGDQIAATVTKKMLNDLDNNKVPSLDTIVQPGFSKYISDYFEIPSGKYIEIGADGVLEIG